MRIQKYLSEQGISSRRKAEDLIKRGLISVNGTVVREMGVQIDPTTDKVEVLPFGQKELAHKTTVVVYKRRGIESAKGRQEGKRGVALKPQRGGESKNIFDILPQFKNLNIVGRLDKASEGLLMLSDDGVIAKAVTGEKHLIEKEYTVSVREETNAGRLKSLEPGIQLEDGPTLPAKIQFMDKHTFRITLREGRNHQIRRMCEHLKLTVVALKRLRIGPIHLGSLRPDDFRILTPIETAKLKAAGASSR